MKEGRPRDRTENSSVFGFCISSGNCNWLIYQEGGFISVKAHLIGCLVKKSLSIGQMCRRRFMQIEKNLQRDFDQSLSLRRLSQQTPGDVC